MNSSAFPNEQLEKIILSSRAIHREVTAALLARLGKIPSALNPRARFIGRLVATPSAYSERELLDAARQTEAFPAGISVRLYRLSYLNYGVREIG
jgi:hypothetical protein